MPRQFYLESVSQKTEATNYFPYGIRYAWSFADDPDLEKHLNEQQNWNELPNTNCKNNTYRGTNRDGEKESYNY